MTVRIVLQARTSSSRLPAKVLLPIGGMPLAVLCARRLGRSNIAVTLATSDDPTDDELSMVAKDAGLTVLRGPLDNVQQRFAAASRDMDDDDVLVRATADNPVPDATIVELMMDDFLQTRADYLGMASYTSVPYGAAVEVFRVGAFRRTVGPQASAHTIEHVTPPFTENPPVTVRDPSRLDAGTGSVRVTVDTLDDYCIAARVFRNLPSPVEAEWQGLVSRFHAIRSCDG